MAEEPQPAEEHVLNLLGQYIEAVQELINWFLGHRSPDDLVPKHLVLQQAAARDALLDFWNGPDPLPAASRIKPLSRKQRSDLDIVHLVSWLEAIGVIMANPQASPEVGLECSVLLLPRSPALVEMSPYEARQAAQSLLAAADRAEYGKDHLERHIANMEVLGFPGALVRSWDGVKKTS